MKIKSTVKLRSVAGEHLVFLPGSKGGDMSKVVAFNETSKFLWESLFDKEFSVIDVRNILLDNYEVAEDVAMRDAQKWVNELICNNVIDL